MSSVRRMVPLSAARMSVSMPTLRGRRRVSGTAKHSGNLAANAVITALVRARFFNIRTAPMSGSICTTSHDNHATVSKTNGRPDRDPGRPDNSILIFTKRQALGEDAASRGGEARGRRGWGVMRHFRFQNRASGDGGSYRLDEGDIIERGQNWSAPADPMLILPALAWRRR